MRGGFQSCAAVLFAWCAGFMPGDACAQGMVIDASGIDNPADDPDEPGEAAIPPRETDSTRVPCLDDLSDDGSPRKGVQVRPFLKHLRLELTALGGLNASDALSSGYTAGGALTFYPSEDFGVEALITYAPVRFKLEGPYRAFDGLRRFEDGSAMQAMLSLAYVPFHAKFKFTESTIIPGDLFLIAGAGQTFHGSVQGITSGVGISFKLYPWKYLAIRIDVRDFILPQEVLGHGRVTHNLAVLGGLSGWFL